MLSRTGGRRAAIAVLTVAVSSAAALWLYRRHKTRSKLTTLGRLEEEEARKARLAKGEQRQKLTDMTKVVTTQPTTAEEWYTIGRELPFDGSAVIDGVTYSEVDLFLRAISLDSSYAPPWNGLGSVCGPHGQVHVPGFGDLTQQEFYEMAVERDETLVRAWVNLARSNGLLLPLTINGVTYNTKQDLVKKALAVNPAYAEAWRIIANTAFESDDLTEDDTIDINGAKYTVPECAIRSLELGDTSAWLTLTMWMDRFGVEKIAVRGEEYTMTDTLKLCVLLDPTEATYWENLATHSRLTNVASVELGGKAWTVLELYREAILVCPSSWKSVYCFFELSGPDIHQVTLNYGDGNVATGCDLAGFAIHEAGPSEAVTVAMAYVALLENARVGKRSSIVVKHRKHPVGPVLQEEELTVLETIQRLETFCADNELFWVLVSRYLNDGLINYANTYTTKSGKVLNATAAAVVALEINENCASAWHYAGLSLLTESNRQEKPLEEFGVKLNDRTEDLSAIQCFVHALDLNTGASDSWLALAQSLKKTHQQHVMICERVHTRLDCWANALDLDDTPESASWVDFGLDLPEGHTYELGKRQIVVRRADCFVAALQIDPMNPQAWHALATALAPGATVAVNGEVELDKKQCEVRAAQHVVEQRTSLAARIWCSLAELLEDDSDVVVVEGDTLHRIDCVLRSLGAAQSKQAWKLLGEFLGPDEEAYLAEGDERVDKETCFANAANLPE